MTPEVFVAPAVAKWEQRVLLPIGLWSVFTASFVSPSPAAPPLYWCPARPPDQQVGAKFEPGCSPLLAAEDLQPRSDKESKPTAQPIRVEDLQRESSAFLKDYRRYLDCCATEADSLLDLEVLDDRAKDILKAAQIGMFSEKMKLKGFTLSEIIPPIARARDNLRGIRLRLEGIEAARERMDRLDYEAAGRERRRIQDMESSIRKDFGLKEPAASPKTGVEIGKTPPNGPQIGHVPPTGNQIGVQGRTGPELGYTPSTVGKEIGNTPPTGFEIGRTGLAGPAIGESELNKQPSGASSTLSGSSVSSDMRESPLKSGLGPSMVGSDLESRPTPPPPDVPLSNVGSSLTGRTP